MNKYQVYENQSLFDIAIQLTGDPVNAFGLALHNNIKVSEVLLAGVQIEIPDNLIHNKEIEKYYLINNIKPATSLTDETNDIIIGCEGIGCWAVDLDFIIS